MFTSLVSSKDQETATDLSFAETVKSEGISGVGGTGFTSSISLILSLSLIKALLCSLTSPPTVIV